MGISTRTGVTLEYSNVTTIDPRSAMATSEAQIDELIDDLVTSVPTE